MSITTIIVLVILASVFLYIVSIYNRLVSLKSRYQNGFAQIEVQLKRRYDLIPNLVETAKAYLEHERGTLEAVISARNQAASGLEKAASNPSDGTAMDLLGQAEGMLNSAMGQLNIVVEAYPDLKANENMMQVSEELTSTENKVAFARQAFNDGITLYNEYRLSLPAVLLAGAFGHPHDAVLLEFADSAEIQAAPKVSF